MDAESASPLPRTQPARGAKSLKHKSKRTMSSASSSFGSSSSNSKGDDAMRELLAGKIAELQVGSGDEPLDAPIDLSGAAPVCVVEFGERVRLTERDYRAQASSRTSSCRRARAQLPPACSKTRS